jgi:hypothetical protein
MDETTDVSAPLIEDIALAKIMAVPGVSEDDATRDAIQGVLADLFVEARWEGVQEGPDPDGMS